MIVTMHVATGAVLGAAVRSRAAAVALGPLLHMIEDFIPHEDIGSMRYEATSGGALLALLALTRGPTDPATIGAVATAAPDLEHVLRPRRFPWQRLFPSHRRAHPPEGLPVWLQLLTAGFLAGVLLGRRR